MDLKKLIRETLENKDCCTATAPPLKTPPPATPTASPARPSASVADKLVGQPKKPETTSSKPPLKTPAAKTPFPPAPAARKNFVVPESVFSKLPP